MLGHIANLPRTVAQHPIHYQTLVVLAVILGSIREFEKLYRQSLRTRGMFFTSHLGSLFPRVRGAPVR